MKLSRIRTAFPWRIAVVLALTPCLPLLAFWAWFTWELPPLQRYYLVAYWDSTEGAKEPGAQTQIRWLSETAPGRKNQLLISSDVTDGSQSGLPMELSSAALGQGWIGIETSQVQSIGSAELEGFLREDFYDGRSLPQMATEPLLYSCVTLVIVVYLVFVMKEEIGDEWRRLRRAVPEPEWRWESGGDRLANQEGLTARIRSHIVRWNSETKFLFNWINFRAAISRHHSINQPVNIERLRGDDEPVSTEVQQESSNPQHLPNPLSSQASKALSNTRPIFRGSSTSHAARSESKPWEESEWID